MGNFRYAVGRPYDVANEGDFRAPSTATSSTPKAGYLATDVIAEHIGQEWRGTAVNGAWVGAKLNGSKSYQAVLVEGINVRSFRVRIGGSDTVTSNSIVRTVTNLTQNPRTKRYSTLTIASGSGQVFGIESTSGSTVDGTSELAVGRIVVIQTLRTMARNWGKNYQYQVASEGSVRSFPGGQVQAISTSQRYLNFQMDGDFDIRSTAETDDAYRLGSLVKADRMVHFENRAADNDFIHAYLGMIEDNPFLVEDFPLLQLDLSMREVI